MSQLRGSVCSPGVRMPLGLIVSTAVLFVAWCFSDDSAAWRSVALAQGQNYALRLFGNGSNAPGLDRVIIPIDTPGELANVGATDFTIEFWIKARPGENIGAAGCNIGDGWITGNTIVDRDTFGGGDHGDFGISLSAGVVAFGLAVGDLGATLCSIQRVDDGAWHHVAAVRRVTGEMQLFIDGQPSEILQGPAGDASYRNGRETTYPMDPYIVLGAEKHDVGVDYPSFSGWIDEVRISSIARYAGAFMRPSAPFTPDAATAALYQFDQGPVGPCTGALMDSAAVPGNGYCAYGGFPNAGPMYVNDTPFTPATPTATASSIPPTATLTPVPPATSTATWTATPLSPPATGTATATSTPAGASTAAPTYTATSTPSPAASAPTPTSTAIATSTATSAATNTPTATRTPGGTIPPLESATPGGQATAAMTPTAAFTPPPCPPQVIVSVTRATPSMAPVGDRHIYMPLIQQSAPCAATTR